MRRLAALCLALASAAVGRAATAQSTGTAAPSAPETAPPQQPDVAPADAAKPESGSPDEAEPDSHTHTPGAPEPKSDPDKLDEDLEEDHGEEEPQLPPPGNPQPSDQKPAPVLQRPRPIEPLRHVEVGGTGGVIHRPSVSADATYRTGWMAGGHVRIEGERFWGLRITGRHESGTGTAEPPVETLDMSRVYIGVQAEPTWAFTDRLAAWLAVGIGWGRTQATLDSELTIRDRTGVFLEIPIGIGIGFELVPDWLRLSASGNVGILTLQSGNLFEPVQAIDASGMLTIAPGLPQFGTSWGAVAGLGVLL